MHLSCAGWSRITAERHNVTVLVRPWLMGSVLCPENELNRHPSGLMNMPSCTDTARLKGRRCRLIQGSASRTVPRQWRLKSRYAT
jgi:hypothetical protein